MNHEAALPLRARYIDGAHRGFFRSERPDFSHELFHPFLPFYAGQGECFRGELDSAAFHDCPLEFGGFFLDEAGDDDYCPSHVEFCGIHIFVCALVTSRIRRGDCWFLATPKV